MVVGELTALTVADAIETERLGDLVLKGKGDPVPAWRVIGAYVERSRERALGGLRAPMIGRDAELRELLALLDDGAGRTVVVAPPGVGKTRLLEELGTKAAQSGARVFRARLRPDLLSPFEPIGQLVRSVGRPDDVVGRIPGARGEVVRDALGAWSHRLMQLEVWPKTGIACLRRGSRGSTHSRQARRPPGSSRTCTGHPPTSWRSSTSRHANLRLRGGSSSGRRDLPCSNLLRNGAGTQSFSISNRCRPRRPRSSCVGSWATCSRTSSSSASRTVPAATHSSWRSSYGLGRAPAC